MTDPYREVTTAAGSPELTPARDSHAAAPPAADHQEDATGADVDGKRRGFFGELPVLIIIAFVLALLLKTFLVQAFFIPSSSMEPTLMEDDRVLVNKLAYRFREPERGEVIVFTKHDDQPLIEPVEPVSPLMRGVEAVSGLLGMGREGERDFIKRIIGLPGETLEMRDGTVYVDGQALPEAPTDEGGYLSARDLEEYGPYEVPEGHYFMMGDNRPNSADSRFPSLGTIPREHVVGRAFVVIWPLDRLQRLTAGTYDEILQTSAAPRSAPAPAGRISASMRS